jgi:hypothetical protein
MENEFLIELQGPRLDRFLKIVTNMKGYYKKVFFSLSDEQRTSNNHVSAEYELQEFMAVLAKKFSMIVPNATKESADIYYTYHPVYGIDSGEAENLIRVMKSHTEIENLSGAADSLLKTAVLTLKLGAFDVKHILEIAQAISVTKENGEVIKGQPQIQAEDMAEAIHYRVI